MSLTDFSLLVIVLWISHLQSPHLTLEQPWAIPAVTVRVPVLPSTAARDAAKEGGGGGLSSDRGACYNPKKLLSCYSFLLMVLILMPRGSFSLLPLPFRQKQPLPATKENLTFPEREEGGLPLI